MRHAYRSGAVADEPPETGASSAGFPQDDTVGGARWAHSITSEIVNTIIAGGLTPDGADLAQLRKSIAAQIAAAVNAVDIPSPVTLAPVAEHTGSNPPGDEAATPEGLRAMLDALFGGANRRSFAAAGTHSYDWEWGTPNGIAIIQGGAGGGGAGGRLVSAGSGRAQSAGGDGGAGQVTVVVLSGLSAGDAFDLTVGGGGGGGMLTNDFAQSAGAAGTPGGFDGGLGDGDGLGYGGGGGGSGGKTTVVVNGATHEALGGGGGPGGTGGQYSGGGGGGPLGAGGTGSQSTGGPGGLGGGYAATEDGFTAPTGGIGGGDAGAVQADGSAGGPGSVQIFPLF